MNLLPDLTAFWTKIPLKGILRIRMFHFDYFTNSRKKNPQNTLLWLQTAWKGISSPTHIYSQVHQKKKGIWISSFRLKPPSVPIPLCFFYFSLPMRCASWSQGFVLWFHLLRLLPFLCISLSLRNQTMTADLKKWVSIFVGFLDVNSAMVVSWSNLIVDGCWWWCK